MTERNDDTPISRTETPTSGGLDRREFIAGAVAAGAGLVACNSEAKAEKAAPPAQAKSTPPAPTTPAAKPDPKAEAKAEAKDEAPPAEVAKKDEAPAKDPAKQQGPKKGFVLKVSHSGATEKIKKTNKDVVRSMVNKALTEFTGAKSPGEAMGKFFKKEDVVGIKVNCLGSPYASVDPATAFALADALHAFGIPKKNIYIYDQYGSRMRKAGFKTLRKGQPEPEDDYRVHYHGTLGYTKKKYPTGGFFKNGKEGSSQFPVLLQERLTAVLNLCCIKDHDLTGVTGAIKNVSYGNVERVPIYHCTSKCNPVCSNDGLCNVSRIYKHEKMGGLVRLVVCDGLRVLYQGGPQDNMTYKKAHNTIMISTDPVAIDRTCVEIVNGYRAERKLKPLQEDFSGRRNPLRFIEAGGKLGLGESDLAKIKYKEVKMA